MRIKPNCKRCGMPFIGGKDDCCVRCQSNTTPGKKRFRPRCLCGMKAVVVVIQEVSPSQEEPFVIEMPLCQECLDLEKELEALEFRQYSDAPENPIHIIVVKSLPRVKPQFKGRRL